MPMSYCSDRDILRDVTVAVCSLNAAKLIEPCLASVQLNRPGRIILVDGGSGDRTREIAQNYVDEIVDDDGTGLANARNMAISCTDTPYICFVGPDNVMPPGSLAKMLRYLSDGPYSGVSAMTRLQHSKVGYVSFSMDQYKRARFEQGERHVIGTPVLFPTGLLREHPYDAKMSCSDDADLCDRLRKKGHRFAISDAVVLEIGFERFRSLLTRWRVYGRSDFEIYRKSASEWSIRRKLLSLLHPLKVELYQPLLTLSMRSKAVVFPFLLVITLLRYYYWIYFRIYSKRGAFQS